MLPQSTSEFVELLKKETELICITDPVDPYLALSHIHLKVVEQKGPALLFTNVIGSKFSVATNLYGSEKRMDLAFGSKPLRLIEEAIQTAETFFPPTFSKVWQNKKWIKPLLNLGLKNSNLTPVLDHTLTSLKELPQIQCWPKDGGAFVTLPLVYTQSPSTQKSNLGMYRIQLFNDTQCGLHIQTHRGGGFHYHEAQSQNQPLPVHIYVGGPPSLTLAAILPLPEDVPELIMASLLQQKKIKMTRANHSPLPFLSDADFCIVGQSPPHLRLPEGPFGDHFGYYSLKHDYPFVNVNKIFHRSNAIYPATVVGRPPQEDHFLACYLQDLLKPLIKLVMPQVNQVWAFEESGVHSLAGAQVKDRYPREALTTSLRILGEGQLSLTKMLCVTNAETDVRDIKILLPNVLERMNFKTDLIVLSHISQDSLDYTTKTINVGSKVIFLGVGEIKQKLPAAFTSSEVPSALTVSVFCRGILVISGISYLDNPNFKDELVKMPAFKDWPLLILVDEAHEATRTNANFLWHVFTRFEPAHDLGAAFKELCGFHAELTPPIVIDARIKPWHAPRLETDTTVSKEIKPILDKIGFS